VKEKLRKLVLLLLALTFAVSTGGIVWQKMNYRRGEQSYTAAEALISLPPAPSAESGTEETEPIPAEPEPESIEPDILSENLPETEPEIAEPEPEPEPEAPAEPEAPPEPELPPETEASPETEVPPETEKIPETAAPEPVPAAPAPKEPPKPEPVERDTYAEELLKTDLAPLREVNEDVIGWIVIPDTTISYPLLQGEDNAHYLTYSWDKYWNPVGSIYLDYRCSGDLGDFNSIIYGHRMYNDSMFNSLQHYKDLEYWKEHPSVYVLNTSGVRRYDVFASYEADTVGGSTYRLGLDDDKGQLAYIYYCLRNSVIDTDIVPDADDRILTLSTCSEANSTTRWVVHCVLRYENITK